MPIEQLASPTVSEASAREPSTAGAPAAPALVSAVDPRHEAAAVDHTAGSHAVPARAPVVAAAPNATNLRFHVDEDTGKTIVSVVDPASGEVLRQIPNEEALAMAKAIGREQGALVDLKI